MFINNLFTALLVQTNQSINQINQSTNQTINQLFILLINNIIIIINVIESFIIISFIIL